MRVRVQLWGNSLALRIPRAVAEDSGIGVGSTVDVRLTNGSLVVTPVPAPTFELAELLSGITDANRHAEVDTGDAVGQEQW